MKVKLFTYRDRQGDCLVADFIDKKITRKGWVIQDHKMLTKPSGQDGTLHIIHAKKIK